MYSAIFGEENTLFNIPVVKVQQNGQGNYFNCYYKGKIMDLFEQIVKSFADANCVTNLEIAAGAIGERLDNLYKGPKVTFFFLNDSELEPITVHGNVPRVGEEVYFNDYLRESRFEGQRRWVVKRVDYSAGVDTSPTPQLFRKLLNGQPVNTCEAQVMLIPYREPKRKIPVH
jgi:hypothetical protein